MVKVIYCFKKKPGLSDEEFHAYWKNTHAAIARRIPGAKRYVQSHGLHRLSGGREPDFDGAAEMWWEDYAAYERAMKSPELQAAFEDETHFIDHDHTAVFLTEEHVVIG